MPSEQIWQADVTFHPEKVQKRGTDKSPDYRVYLPEVYKKLGLSIGDDALLETKTERGVTFIHGEAASKVGATGEAYTIFKDGSTRPRVTLPSEWADYFIDYDGDDVVVVEINTITDHFRIYKNGEHNYRKATIADEHSPKMGMPRIVIGVGTAEEHVVTQAERLRAGFGDDIDDEAPG